MSCIFTLTGDVFRTNGSSENLDNARQMSMSVYRIGLSRGNSLWGVDILDPG